MTFDPGNRLIAALDVSTRAEADALVARLAGEASWIKIGLELFCGEGPAIVRDHVAAGQRVMLDLKLHDIPETVARATAKVASLGAGLLTVHAGGGRAMLEAAVKNAGDMRVLAVTVLTSLDDTDLDIEVLFDDRDERPGAKFKDADLIGIPFRVNIGKKLPQGLVEIVTRRERKATDVLVTEALERLQRLKQDAMR